MPDPSARSLLNIYQVQIGRFFTDHEFNIDVKSQLLPLVLASIVMYYRVFINMLPTPSKAHYVFNLRDLSKLVRGMMQANPLVVITKEHLVDLFTHECIRVFNDRLVTQDDNQQFYTHLSETVSDYFKMSIYNPYGVIEKRSPRNMDEDESSGTLVYGDFMKNDERVYQPLNNWKQLVSVLSEYQMRSNMSGLVSKQIVFFKEAVEHICRLITFLLMVKLLRFFNKIVLLLGRVGSCDRLVVICCLLVLMVPARAPLWNWLRSFRIASSLSLILRKAMVILTSAMTSNAYSDSSVYKRNELFFSSPTKTFTR